MLCNRFDGVLYILMGSFDWMESCEFIVLMKNEFTTKVVARCYKNIEDPTLIVT